MSLEVKVTMNLYSDWIEILKNKLISMGFKIEPFDKGEEISLRFFNLQKRLVSSKPRNILISKEFSCPCKYQNGLNLIIDKIKGGYGITPHLSKKISNLDYDDALLNDWGIHHLHLGIQLEDDGFITRTGELLYVRFDNQNAYFVNVMEHDRWTDQNILKIIHNNWPDSIKQYKLNEVVEINQKLTDNDIRNFRKAGALALVEVEKGSVYMPIGGGYASSRTSIEVVRTSDYYFTLMKNIEDNVRNNISNIVKELDEKQIEYNNEFDFNLELSSDGEFLVVEKQSLIKISFGKL